MTTRCCASGPARFQAGDSWPGAWDRRSLRSGRGSDPRSRRSAVGSRWRHLGTDQLRATAPGRCGTRGHRGRSVTAGPVDYDAELTRYSAVLRRAWAVQPHDRVLDVGCGTGQTTREAARMAQAGSALGVDLSALAIARAR